MDNIFIGSRIIIPENAKIGLNAVIEADCLIKTDISSNSVVVGLLSKRMGFSTIF